MTDSKLVAVSNIIAAFIIKGTPLSQPSQIRGIVTTALDILGMAEQQEKALETAARQAQKTAWAANSDEKSSPGQPIKALPLNRERYGA